MAKMNRMFSYRGTFNDVTIVKSRLYGEHMRSKRGTKKKAVLNESFQKSVDLNRLANPCAKAIKDALDPFRQNFKDGSMWGRLVGLFKTSLRKNPVPDFSLLLEFEFYNRVPFGTRYAIDAKISFSQDADPSIRVDISSHCLLSLEKMKADSYLQTLIIIFLDGELKASTSSERVTLPLKQRLIYNEGLKQDTLVPETQEQTAQWPIPAGSKTALIVVKCEACLKEKPITNVKFKGMKVVKVCEMGG